MTVRDEEFPAGRCITCVGQDMFYKRHHFYTYFVAGQTEPRFAIKFKQAIPVDLPESWPASLAFVESEEFTTSIVPPTPLDAVTYDEQTDTVTTFNVNKYTWTNPPPRCACSTPGCIADAVEYAEPTARERLCKDCLLKVARSTRTSVRFRIYNGTDCTVMVATVRPLPSEPIRCEAHNFGRVCAQVAEVSRLAMTPSGNVCQCGQPCVATASGAKERLAMCPDHVIRAVAQDFVFSDGQSFFRVTYSRVEDAEACAEVDCMEGRGVASVYRTLPTTWHSVSKTLETCAYDGCDEQCVAWCSTKSAACAVHCALTAMRNFSYAVPTGCGLLSYFEVEVAPKPEPAEAEPEPAAVEPEPARKKVATKKRATTVSPTSSSVVCGFCSTFRSILLVPDADIDLPYAQLETVARCGTCWTQQTAYQRPDGQMVFFYASRDPNSKQVVARPCLVRRVAQPYECCCCLSDKFAPEHIYGDVWVCRSCFSASAVCRNCNKSAMRILSKHQESYIKCNGCKTAFADDDAYGDHLVEQDRTPAALKAKADEESKGFGMPERMCDGCGVFVAASRSELPKVAVVHELKLLHEAGVPDVPTAQYCIACYVFQMRDTYTFWEYDTAAEELAPRPDARPQQNGACFRCNVECERTEDLCTPCALIVQPCANCHVLAWDDNAVCRQCGTRYARVENVSTVPGFLWRTSEMGACRQCDGSGKMPDGFCGECDAGRDCYREQVHTLAQSLWSIAEKHAEKLAAANREKKKYVRAMTKRLNELRRAAEGMRLVPPVFLPHHEMEPMEEDDEDVIDDADPDEVDDSDEEGEEGHALQVTGFKSDPFYMGVYGAGQCSFKYLDGRECQNDAFSIIPEGYTVREDQQLCMEHWTHMYCASCKKRLLEPRRTRGAKCGGFRWTCVGCFPDGQAEGVQRVVRHVSFTQLDTQSAIMARIDQLAKQVETMRGELTAQVGKAHGELKHLGQTNLEKVAALRRALAESEQPTKEEHSKRTRNNDNTPCGDVDAEEADDDALEGAKADGLVVAEAPKKKKKAKRRPRRQEPEDVSSLYPHFGQPFELNAFEDGSVSAVRSFGKDTDKLDDPSARASTFHFETKAIFPPGFEMARAWDIMTVLFKVGTSLIHFHGDFCLVNEDGQTLIHHPVGKASEVPTIFRMFLKEALETGYMLPSIQKNMWSFFGLDDAKRDLVNKLYQRTAWSLRKHK
jgi:hypothetical protein